MPASLVPSLDVDGRQLRALVRVALKLDLRSGTARADGSRRRTSGAGRSIRLLVTYAMAGGWVAFFIAPAESFFAASLFHLSVLTLMVGALVVLEFNSIVLSSEDFQILGHQPMTSATFFFARLVHALIYTHALGLSFSVAPLAVLTFGMRGPQLWVGFVALLATCGAIVVVTLVGVAVYAAILRFARPRRMRAILTASQLALSLLVYSALLGVRRSPRIDSLPNWSLEGGSGVLLYPPAWFASWIDLAARGISWQALLGLGLSGLLIGAWLLISVRVLSKRYAERLAAFRDVRDPEGMRPRGRRRLFRKGEAGALGLLVPRQFRHDYRFRLGVLSVLPLTFLYLVIALEEGPPPDPFLVPQLTPGSLLLYMAILISPALMVPSFVYSESFAAAWIYHVTPIDRRRMVLSVRNYIAAAFVVPYLACIALMLAYFYGSLWHGLAHAAILGLCSGLFLLLAMLFNPGLPFGTPVQRGRFSLRTLVPFVLAPLFAFLALPPLLRTGYASPAAVAVSALCLLAINGLLGRFVAGRIATRTAAPLHLG